MVVIKPLDVSHAEAIKTLERQVYEPLGGPVTGEFLIGTSVRYRGTKECFGAFSEEVLVGYLLVILREGVWYVSDIAVHPDYRRRGIAGQLITEFAKVAGSYQIDGDCFKESYYLNTRSGIWEKLSYYVIVTGPNRMGQIHIERHKGFSSKFLLRYLPSWEADRIAELEAQVYPVALQNGEEDFREDLEDAERRGDNFSYGFVNETGKLVAYLIAYVLRSKKGYVMYVSDWVVHPNFEQDGLGGKLLVHLLRTTRQFSLSLVGECREQSYRLLSEHPKFLARLGYCLTRSELLPDYNGGENYWSVRLEPIQVNPCFSSR